MIYALSSSAGGGRSAVAVIRLSGSDSFIALERLLKGQKFPDIRRASVRFLYHPVSGDLLDSALVLAFSGPDSFTGEDMVELHIHGGRAVVRSVLGALGEIDGSRLAVAGEFSRLAFSHGKLDFTGAEGLVDLINADTEVQRRLALRSVSGEVFDLFEVWCGRVSRMLAYVEACLDFSDEELPVGLSDDVLGEVKSLADEMRLNLSFADSAESLREGIRVSLFGSPNVGKSSLLNYFAGRDAAIVSEVAGTTRDVIEVFLELGGYPVILSDSAGLREDADVGEVEGEGIRRSLDLAERSDICLWVYDLADLGDDFASDSTNNFGRDFGDGDILILNKVDLVDGVPDWVGDLGVENFVVSAVGGDGLEELESGLLGRLSRLGGVLESGMILRMRHAGIVRDVLVLLDGIVGGRGLELVAEDLRGVLVLLGRVTGRVSTDDLLDIIFSDFCIGK